MTLPGNDIEFQPEKDSRDRDESAGKSDSTKSASTAKRSTTDRATHKSRTPDRTASFASDRLLFARIAASDEAAFEAIFDKYTAILYPYILDLVKIEADAKEIIQEVFLKLWLKRDTLPAIENPGGWLYTVAANEAYLHFRKEARYARRLQKVSADDPAQSDQNLADIHEQFDSKEVKSLIAEAVKQLPIRRRQVFQMSRLEGYSRKEIAETLGISENTVRNQLTDAVEFIQDYIVKNRSLYLPALLIGMLAGVTGAGM